MDIQQELNKSYGLLMGYKDIIKDIETSGYKHIYGNVQYDRCMNRIVELEEKIQTLQQSL